ncbi:homocysteine S-methyltransferase [candidate division KSB1 bacterium]|nr:homocysteine S-methyltransferase [candidate division KSB1 bacterium]
MQVSSSIKSPLTVFLEMQGFLLLDGGLATELEKRGHNLNTKLWSAGLLNSHPDEIRAVHRAYLEAGADCIISATYQATVPGFMEAGLSEKEAKSLIQKAVAIARDARDEYFASCRNGNRGKTRPLIAASIGPYGAYLADGSEFRGNYSISPPQLRAFHESRWEILADSGADLFACETIPSLAEALVLRDLMKATPDVFAWVSFSCIDGQRISDGTPIRECTALFEECEQVVAVGINCTAPKFIPSLITEARKGTPTKPVVVYPNLGETYDDTKRAWIGASESVNFAKAAIEWFQLGARLLGGCCRTTPNHIAEMRSSLLSLHKPA